MNRNKPKVLFTASITNHFILFHQPYLKWFQDIGFEVHVACNRDDEVLYCDKQWKIPFERSPYSLNNLKVYKQLKNLIETESFDIIHCHTAMASVLTRLASRRMRRSGAKVLYTAHGFHFFKGGPLTYWLTYYPVEIILSGLTDAIITLNQEDFNLIKNKGSSNTDYYLVPGVGVKSNKFHPVNSVEKNQLRGKNGINYDDFVAIYAAEFIDRKNHHFILNSAKILKHKMPKLKILFAGRGELREELEEKVSKLNLKNTIQFLGYRTDIDEIYKLSDIGISASRQEGLPINLVESMMCGLPVVVTSERGHNEIVDHGVNGFIFEQNDRQGFIDSVAMIADDPDLHSKFSKAALEKAAEFELSNALSEMTKIYKQYIKQDVIV